VVDGEEREGLLSELDDVTGWLAARAADAPTNFLHLLRLLEAERAWTVGDFRAGALAFDAALREAGQRQRLWHRALDFRTRGPLLSRPRRRIRRLEPSHRSAPGVPQMGREPESRPTGLGLPDPGVSVGFDCCARRRQAG